MGSEDLDSDTDTSGKHHYVFASSPVRWIITAGILFALSLLGSNLLLIYLVGPVTIFVLLRPLLARHWVGLRSTLMAVALGGLIASIFVVPMLIEQAGAPDDLDEGGDVRYSADLLTLVTPSFYHPLFGQMPYTGRVLGIDPFERMGYVGIAAGLLALLGIWRQRAARGWLALAVAAWVFSLGPLLKVFDSVVLVNLGDQASYVTLPWLWFQNLPLVTIVRTPARFDFVVALAVAVMAGYGAGWLWERMKTGRWPLFAVLIALVIFDYQSFWPFPTIPGTVPEPVQALAQRDDIRAVFDLPWEHLLAEKDGMFLQTGHQKPMIAGQIARRTPVDPAKLTVLQDTLDPALLDAAGVDLLILHKEWADDADTFQARMPGDLLYDDASIAVYEVPAQSDSPQSTSLPSDDSSIEGHVDSYLYAPEPGWTTLTGQLQAGGRDIALLLDGQQIHRWDAMDAIALNLPLPISTAGYHTVTLAVEPPCPQHFSPTLRCRSVQVDSLAFGAFTPGTLPDPVPFAGGVELAGYSIESDAKAVRLWWRFDTARTENDIRFVHVVSTDGEGVAQEDGTLGPQPAGSTWTEQVTFDDLPAGTYDIYAGWYTYPDLTRFLVLADVPGAPDGWVHLGNMIVEH